MADTPFPDRDGPTVLDRLAAEARATALRPAPGLARVRARATERHRRRRATGAAALVFPVVVLALAWIGLAGTAEDGTRPVVTDRPEQPDRAPEGTTPTGPTTTTDPSTPVGPVTITETGIEVEALAPSPLAAREAVASAWTGTELLVWGGSGSDGTGRRVFDDGAAYDPASGRWRTLPPAPLSARARATASWSGSAFYVWGGTATADGVGGLLDGAAYDPASNSWRSIAPAPAGTDRSFGSAAWVRGRLVIGAGSTPMDDDRGTVLVYDPTDDAWAVTEVAGEVVSLVATDEEVAVLTLSLVPFRANLQVTWFDPVLRSSQGGPSFPTTGSVDHVGGVWTGEDLVVAVAGAGSEGLVATTGRDDSAWRDRRTIAADQSWAWPRSIGFMPSPDLLVWTGSEAVSFGGGTGEPSWYDPTDGEVATGAAYADHDGPCGYDGAIAWTGSEVLVWGGQSCRSDAPSPQTASGVRVRRTG